jgi:tetratricopeptide (TPR) repeat protein
LVFSMSLAASVLSIWIHGLELATVAGPPSSRTWPERLVTAGDAVWFYLGKLIWPHPLIFIYPRWEIDAGRWFSYLPLLAVVVVFCVLWFKCESWSRPWFFTFAYFLAALLPVLGLADMIFLRYSVVADHFQYLAGMGPLALVGAGLARFSDSVIPGKRWFQPILGAGLLLALVPWSWERVWVYESREALWTDVLANDPKSWTADNALGNVLFQKGDMEQAVTCYQKALTFNPNYSEARYNLGKALLQEGQMDQAIEQLQETLKIDPNLAEAYEELGVAFIQNGRRDEAIMQFQKALAIDPDFAEAHYNLGVAFLQEKGEANAAIAEFQKALVINPNSDATHNDLGGAFFQKGEMDAAMAEFQEALRLNPDNSNAQNNLAKLKALIRQGTAPPQ